MAITSQHGVIRFIRKTFGLTNASWTFQRATDIIIAAVKGQFAAVYVDNFIFFSMSPPLYHVERVSQVVDLYQSPDSRLNSRNSRCLSILFTTSGTLPARVDCILPYIPQTRFKTCKNRKLGQNFPHFMFYVTQSSIYTDLRLNFRPSD